MSTIAAIDPGNTESALVVWDGYGIVMAGKKPNDDVLKWIITNQLTMPLVIEKVASYGMAVGESIFETVHWTGRFTQAYGAAMVIRIPRMEVKMHLCHNSRAKDGNIRQALIDRFGEPGTKNKPGLLYGITGDLWAALALAVTFWDSHILTKGVI